MPTSQTRLWDASGHLEGNEDILTYLDTAFEDGDPVLIRAILSDFAKTMNGTVCSRIEAYQCVAKVLKWPM